jgi:hypothetical protein
VREALVGEHHYEEVMVAWDEHRCWAYYVSRCTLPLSHAQLEYTAFEPTPRGTRLRWIIAADPRPLLEQADPVFRSTMDSLFQRAATRLETRLASR